MRLFLMRCLSKARMQPDWNQTRLVLSGAEIYKLLSCLEHSVYLDSGPAPDKGRFNIISGAPSQHSLEAESLLEDVEILRTNEQQSMPAFLKPLPFICGILGFVSYDFGNRTQNITKKSTEFQFPDFAFGYYTWSYVYDKQEQEGWLTFSPACSEQLRNQVLLLIEEGKMINKGEMATQSHNGSGQEDIEWHATQTIDSYKRSFENVIDYIYAGDCYQINLTQQFRAQFSGKGIDLYTKLRDQVNTHYAAYMQLDSQNSILSFSPEQFLSIDKRKISTRPIKGTIENTADNHETLINSTKDRAENLMIVDLLRNDLSKVSKAFSVKVPELFTLESYTNVHHLVSCIEGELEDNISELAAFLSCFPGGSITGAPKKRAMEIIAEQEPHTRGPYCGSIFYWDDSGRFDSNILIRTIAQTNDDLYCWGGGGIVADSQVDNEYEESITKVSNLMGSINPWDANKH